MTSVHLSPLKYSAWGKPLALLLAAGLGLTTLTACASQDDEKAVAKADEKLSVENCGTTITLDKQPAKVFTVGTAAVELLDAAGATDKIVGRSGEFGAPLSEDVKNPPAEDLIVDPADPTTENILTAAPDVVFGYGLFNANTEELDKAGIASLTVNGECGHDAETTSDEVDLYTVTDDIRRLGKLFKTESTANEQADALEERIKKNHHDKVGHGSAAWVYYFSSSDPLSAYGGKGISPAILRSAGMENAYADEKDAYLTVSTESLLQKQPEWIVLSYGLYGETKDEALKQFLAEPGIKALDAVKKERIILLPGSASSPAPSAVAGLEELVKQSHELAHDH
ncbi:ABC transporter substrate-binding protein [Micrococcoides hystricis]|uniref:ABC transporter substrate-binding protein n=1 Tax=Micrococcoides hystricis TaxID=1572761 RepID=A0ABV6PDP0_9MICC